jgi:uncharacterized membrane protein
MLFMQTLRRGLSPLLLATALTACGPDLSQDGPASSDGSVTISPPTIDLDLSDTAMTACGAGTVGQAFFPVIIATFDARGFPVGNADITLQVDFSPTTTFGGTPSAMSLWDSTGTTLLTPLGGSPSVTRQTQDDGTATFQLLLDTSIGCSYAGSLTVNSGSLIESMQVTATGN